MGVSALKTQHFEPLLDWLKRERISQAELGRRVGRNRRDIHRICTGRVKFIDPAVAMAIERATGGAVTAVDYVNFFREKC